MYVYVCVRVCVCPAAKGEEGGREEAPSCIAKRTDSLFPPPHPTGCPFVFLLIALARFPVRVVPLLKVYL